MRVAKAASLSASAGGSIKMAVEDDLGIERQSGPRPLWRTCNTSGVSLCSGACAASACACFSLMRVHLMPEAQAPSVMHHAVSVVKAVLTWGALVSNMEHRRSRNRLCVFRKSGLCKACCSMLRDCLRSLRGSLPHLHACHAIMWPSAIRHRQLACMQQRPAAHHHYRGRP